MTNLSAARKISILGRIVLDHAGRNRTAGALISAAKTTVFHVGHVLHLLWLQVTGFIFLSVGAIAGFAFQREYAQYQQGLMGPGRAILAGCVTLLFAWFGLTSFWRAARKKR
jgi:hypothetical protein